MKTAYYVSEVNSTLIHDHMALAHKLGHQFYRRYQHIDSLERDDFLSAATYGLVDAASRFDSDKGSPFIPFAVLRIRGELMDLLRKHGQLSRKDYRDKKHATGEGDATVRTIAHSSVDLHRMGAELENYGVRVHWGDAKETSLSYADELSPEERCTQRSQRKFLQQLIADLPSRQGEIVRQRYFNEQTFEEMRPHFDGASKSWLCRLHAKALKNLREALADQTGEPVLDLEVM